MSTPHLIERIDFEIEFDPPDAELQDERNLARLLQDTLLPVVDEVLEAWDEPGTVLSLPSLSIDLGVIERTALREQAPARLRALLEEALAAARYRSIRAPGDASPLEDGAAPSRRSAQDDALAQLSAYLASGRMAWHHDLTRSDAHVALLDSLLGGNRAALVRMLARSIAQPQALRRLSEQFPARQLAAIVRAAAPRHATGLLAVQAEWRHGRRSGVSRWQVVLGLALGGQDTAVVLSALGSTMAQPARPAVAGLSSIQIDGLVAWWRRGERDPGQAAVLERLLDRVEADGLRQALAAALAVPGGARRLVAAVPASLREKLLRVAAPACAARLLALMGEIERELVARIADRAVAAEVHAQCWEEVLTASLHRVALAPSTSVLRARLLALVADAGQLGQSQLAIQVSTGATGCHDEFLLLAEFLDSGRFKNRSSAHDEHVILFDRLLSRVETNAGAADALRELLRTVLSRPASLRRLTTQFPQRQLIAINRILALHRRESAIGAGGRDRPVEARTLRTDADAANLQRIPGQAGARGDGARAGGARGGVHEQQSRSMPLLDAAQLPMQAFPPRQRTSAEAPDELAMLGTFLATGRIARLPGKRGRVDHIELMDRLLHRAGLVPGLLSTLLRLLAHSLALPEALRRFTDQFPQRQLAAILHAVAPGVAATVLAEFAEPGESECYPSASDARLAAWRKAFATGLARHAFPQSGAGKLNLSGGGPPIRSASSLGQVSATSISTYAIALASATVVDDARATLLRPLAERFRQRGLAAAVADTLHQRLLASAPGRSMDSSVLLRDDVARLRAYLDASGLTILPGMREQIDHIGLLGQLPARAAHDHSLRSTLQGVLARSMSRPQALRRLIDQFPQRQLMAILDAAAPGEAGFLLAASAENTESESDEAGSDRSSTTQPGTHDRIGLQPLPRLIERLPQPDLAPVAIATSKARPTPSPNEIARLREYLVTGRLPVQHEANVGGDHIDLLDRLLERADRIPSLLQALLRMLATELTRPQALRRLTEQFPQRQLVSVLYAAAPAHTASFLALFAEIQGEQALSNPASTDHELAAWRTALERALSGRVVGTAGARIPDTPANLRRAASPGLATLDKGEDGGAGRAAIARAFRRALAVPDGALRLARSMQERRRELLVWSTAPAVAVEVFALLHEVGAHKSGVELACWAEVFEACLAPDPLSVGVLRARLRELTTPVQPARLPADADRKADRIVLLAAFLRDERHPAAQTNVHRDDHVTLLDALLDGAEPLPDLWPMLASSLEHAPAAIRLVEQFPERQLRDIIAQAAPAHSTELFALVAALHRDGAATGIAPRPLRLAIWQALLRAVVRYAAGLATLPAQEELRERVFAPLPESAPKAAHPLMRAVASLRTPPLPWRRAKPEARVRGVPDSSTSEGWLGRIGQQRDINARIVPKPRQGMIESAPGDGSAQRIAFARAFKRALAAPDGALRLAGSMQERRRELLVWSSAPEVSVEVLALLHEVGAHKSEVELACWGEVFEACLAPGPVSVGVLRARLRELTTAVQLARLPADADTKAGRIELLAAFLRNERYSAAQTDVQGDDHVTLLDALLEGAEPPRDLWRMLASSLEHAPAALRLVEQFPERQLRDIVAQAAPAHSTELFMLVEALHREGAVAGIAQRPLRLTIWPVLLRAVARYAAGLAPLPAQEELRAHVYALLPASATASNHPVMRAVTGRRTPPLPWRRAEPELQAPRAIRRLLEKVGDEQPAPTPISSLTRRVMAECAALNLAVEARGRELPDSSSGEEWLARIRQHLTTDPRIVPARRQAMIEAIASAASASGREQEYVRRALHTLASGESLDLDAIAGAVQAQDAPVDRVIQWPALLASRRADVIRLLRRSARHPAIREALTDCLPPSMLLSLAEAARPEITAAVPATRRQGPADAPTHPGAQPGERIALNNAGMVLMAPYVTRLFAMLGLVKEGEFVDLAAAERAVHLLQFAVSGETDAPEYRLSLNKLLCGLPLDAPVPAGIDITPEERSTIEGLLEAMIASWSALGRTSIDGLRQSFLMREGELELGAELWQLAVAQGPFDMLMDRLPWSFSIVKFAWMPLPLHVTWH